ncbi:hypothetical protein HQ576_06920 [bacterium]|nr:hypothetical protein [bacterium]
MPPNRPRRRSSRDRARRPSQAAGAGSRASDPGSAGQPPPAAAPAATHDPYLGRDIGGYILLERTATGPQTLTFAADQPAMARRVTLEMLTEEAAADDAVLVRFYDSARLAARAHHGSILAIYDVSSAGDVHYCAIEHVEGRSLGAMVRAREKFAYDDAVRVAIDVADALHAANESGIPGLELSLDRVVVSSRGEVKLRLPTLTPADAPVLDDRYIMTAVGVALYAMLSGGRVAGVEDALEPGSPLVAQLAPIKSVAMSTRSDVAQGVDRLLGTGGAEPFASLASARAALDALLQSQASVDTRARSGSERVRRRPQKGKGLLVGGLAVGAVVVIAVVILLVSSGTSGSRTLRRFGDVRAAVTGLLKQAEDSQRAFNRAPAEQGAQQVVACYQQALAHYRQFLSEYPQAAEAPSATQHIRQIEGFVPVFQADAQRRMRHVAVAAELRAIGTRMKAEVERLKKTGGTLDLVHWRVQYTRLVDRHGGGRDVMHTVQTWLDALPRMVQRGQMAIDAEQVVRDCESNHAPKNDYRACVKAWDDFHAKYRTFDHLRDQALERHDDELNKLRRGAALAYHRLDGEAKRLVAQKKPKSARAIYRKIIATFGFDSLVSKAKAELAKLPEE